MPIDVTIPDVYIEEDASPAISVSQAATAVPLFIAGFKPTNDKFGEIIRINSWLDYATNFHADTTYKAEVKFKPSSVLKAADAKSATDAKWDVNVIDPSLSVALYLYFQNGGGACYLYALDEAQQANQLNALPHAIQEVEDITLLVCPELDKTKRDTVYQALSAILGESKGYFLLADSEDASKPQTLGSDAHIALYYPKVASLVSTQVRDTDVSLIDYKDKNGNPVTTLNELRAIDSELAKRVKADIAQQQLNPVLIPPSALMAGVYCKTDCERGVWKAPANVELVGVADVTVRVSKTANLKPYVNVLRHFDDRGVVVWGSRTLLDDDNWRYIPVRRLFDKAERDIKKSLRAMVFEPNSQPTWQRVQTAIENYLNGLWQQGGLAGNQAREAYLVRVGLGSTMTQDDIDQGKMIIQIGLAAVRPAEFIILQFTQDMSQ